MRPPFGKSYVRIRFGGQKEYTYYCPGARVGDTVVLPPNAVVPHEQRKRVVALGRRHWGSIRAAELLADVNKREMNRKMPGPIKLGSKYRDTISGFVGTATARTEYMHGCVRVLLEAEGYKPDDREQMFDEQRLVEVNTGQRPEPTARAGGPQTPPTRATTPLR